MITLSFDRVCIRFQIKIIICLVESTRGGRGVFFLLTGHFFCVLFWKGLMIPRNVLDAVDNLLIGCLKVPPLPFHAWHVAPTRIYRWLCAEFGCSTNLVAMAGNLLLTVCLWKYRKSLLQVCLLHATSFCRQKHFLLLIRTHRFQYASLNFIILTPVLFILLHQITPPPDSLTHL